MAFKSSNPFRVTRPVVLVDGYEATTASGNLTLTRQSSTYQAIDPNGSDRNVTLPAEEVNNGLSFVIYNSGSAGEDLAALNDAAATIRTINAGECALFICSGSAWASFPMAGLATIASLDDSGYLYGGLDLDWYLHHDGDKGLEIGIANNDATALRVLQGAEPYLTISTVTGAEAITFGGIVDNPDYVFAGTGDFTGSTLGTVTLKGTTAAHFGDDVGVLDFSGAGALSETGITTLTLSVVDLTLTGSTSAHFGDDIATWDFDGAGAVSETGITTFSLTPSGSVDIDAGGAVTIDSSAGAITIGGDAVAQPLYLGTAGARSIQIGSAAAAVVAIDAGVGSFAVLADTTIDLDAGGALGIESSGGAITIGGDAVAQAVNLGTGAAARVITIGNAASASLDLEAGVGAWTLQGDTSGSLTAGTGLTITCANSSTWGISANAAGNLTLTVRSTNAGAGQAHLTLSADEALTLAGTTIPTSGRVIRAASGTGTGLVTFQEGTSATEGWQTVVYEATVAPAAVETALLTVPAGSVVDAVWANVATALTGGGTTATWSIGVTGDVDKYGTAAADNYMTQGDSLAANGKWSGIASVTPAAAAGAGLGLFSATAVDLKLIAAATGGTAVGDTALTVGTVRVRVCYRTILPFDNA